jgi:hypothetical protein
MVSFAVKHLASQLVSEKEARNEARPGGRVASLRPPPQINGEGGGKEFIWRKRGREKGGEGEPRAIYSFCFFLIISGALLYNVLFLV